MGGGVWNRLLGTRGAWMRTCAAGPPVPTADTCAGLDCDSVRLTELAPGERGSVSCLHDPGGSAAARLAAMGLLPGTTLRLVQRRPAYIFRIGHSEFAIDEQLAMHVRVHRLNG